MLTLLIDNGTQQFQPAVADKITWSLERQGVPGKLSFSVYQDSALSFTEGSRVCLFVNQKAVFYGFVFERKPKKDKTTNVVAYDQLRYLKNKDTYVYENKTATEVIRMIAADFNLSVGTLDDTGFKIESRSEPDKTLFDIILTALGLTTISTGQMYTLYDDYGKLTLKNMANMKLNILIHPATAQDYSYTSSIDGETYNQVKVSIDNEETGKRDAYIAKHTENINAWGVLQHYYKADSKETNGQAVADQLLVKYNHKTKKLSIKEAFGDIQVRAGCLLPVMLDLGDMRLNNYMLAEKVEHTFEGCLHTMDLTLRGGEFSA